jgi:hypothetical protein
MPSRALPAQALALAFAVAVFGGGCGTEVWTFENNVLSDAGLDGDATWSSGCTSDRDCSFPGLVCDTTSGACVACLDDSQCTIPERPRCDSALHQCVECGTSGDCASNEICEPTSHHCIPTCFDGGSCPQTAPNCDPYRGVCMQCSSSIDCVSFAGRVCNPASGTCVECVWDAQCFPPMGRCNQATDQCVGCLTSGDCDMNQVCDPSTYTCRSRTPFRED